MIKSPRLIDDTLKEVGRFSPLTLSVDLHLDEISSATMTLREDDIPCAVGDWVAVDTIQGEAGLFVVKSISTDIVKRTRSVTLKDVRCLLVNDTICGKFETKDIQSGASTVSPTKATQFVIGKQQTGLWRFGSCIYGGTYAYEFSDSSLYNALERIRSALTESYLEIDTSALPFAIHIKRRPSAVESELREARNIRGCKVSQDTSQMYTRVYPRGHFNSESGYLMLPETYLEENTETYGIISCIDTEDGITTVAALRSWAQERLDNASKPIIGISCDGLALCDATGESLDRFTLGTKCRVVLPEHDINEVETITDISFSDALGKPELCTVQMTSQKKNVESILKKVTDGTSSMKGGHGGGGGVAEEIEWLTASMGGWNVQLKQMEGSQLWQQRDVIVGVVGRVDGLEGSVTTIEGSVLWQDREHITGVVGTLETDTDGNLIVKDGSGLFIERSGVKLGVYDSGNLTAGIMVSKLNDGTTTTKISANRIELSGYVTASELSALSARFDNLVSGATTALELKAVSASFGALTDLNGNQPIKSISDGVASGGTITCTYTKWNNQTATFSFNIADTEYYQSGVSAARKAGWNDCLDDCYLSIGDSSQVVGTGTVGVGGSYYVNLKGKSYGGSYATQETIRVKGPDLTKYSSSAVTLYYYERNQYYSAGSHIWYYD